MKPRKRPARKKTVTPPRARRVSIRGSASLPEPEARVSRRLSNPSAKPVLKLAAETGRVFIRNKVLKVPPILLEGDEPPRAPAGAPPRKFAAGSTPAEPPEPRPAQSELPLAYGTKQLLLAARDPHWLYAHWDLTDEQQRHCNSLARDGHLVLRVYLDEVSARPVQEIHVQPDSRHWFTHVERAGAKYVAELGFHSADGKWTAVSTSAATFTPPDSISADTRAEFATIPFDLPMGELLSLVNEALPENIPLARAIEELRARGHRELPALSAQGAEAGSVSGEWTPAQELALAGFIQMYRAQHLRIDSISITELVRKNALNELGPNAAELPTSPGARITDISSPAGGWAQPGKGFWFNVNAELIIYGATERDATVTIAGREIKLRPDGSFSCRFALPDGQYELPLVAVSADKTDGRAAQLSFRRSTVYHGEVGAHPQDPDLGRPDSGTLPQ